MISPLSKMLHYKRMHMLIRAFTSINQYLQAFENEYLTYFFNVFFFAFLFPLFPFGNRKVMPKVTF